MSVSENQCNLMALADQYFVLQNFFDSIHKRGESNENRVYRFGDDRGDPFTEDRRKRGGETERRLFLRRQGGQDVLHEGTICPHPLFGLKVFFRLGESLLQ